MAVTKNETPYADWFADQFAEIEAKDHRVTKITVRQPFAKHMADLTDRIRGKTYLWNAIVVVNQKIAAGTIVFEHKQFDYERVPAKAFTKRVQIRTKKPRVRSTGTGARGASR